MLPYVHMDITIREQVKQKKTVVNDCFPSPFHYFFFVRTEFSLMLPCTVLLLRSMINYTAPCSNEAIRQFTQLYDKIMFHGVR